jgi:hypothetical protein
MKETTNILGCTFSICNNPDLSENENKYLTNSFRLFLWDKEGLANAINQISKYQYGKDMELILFQFEVNPSPYLLQYLKPIENYRKKEKAIGIPIIVTDENFFGKSKPERYNFIKESILQKMELLAEVVKKKKLDTNMELLKKDLQAVLEQWQP